MRLLFLLFLITFIASCDMFNHKTAKKAPVKNLNIDQQINPEKSNQSVIETQPLINNATKSLLAQAQISYHNNQFDSAISTLERAFDIQPKTPQISQLLAEIYLHKGDFDQAHYWASIATKNGPSKGKVCEKSWRILALAAQQLGYFAQQELALNNKDQCLVTAEERF